MLTNKRPDLFLLSSELQAAGVDVSRGLGCYGVGDDPDPDSQIYVHTYSATGEIIDLPPEAQAVLDAHVLPEPETPPTEILLSLLQDVTDVDETKPILEAMLLILGGSA